MASNDAGRSDPAGYDYWKQMLLDKYGAIEAILDAEYPLPPSIRFFWMVARWDRFFMMFTPLLIAYLLWPWVTVLALLIFRWSMRRARVKPVHVLRCVVYSLDVGLWVGLAVVIATVSTIVVTPWATFNQGLTAGLVMLSLATALVAVYRLWVAYRKYLQFDHPFLTVWSSQTIVSLCLVWFLLNWR